HINVRLADDRIISGSADQRVVACVAVDDIHVFAAADAIVSGSAEGEDRPDAPEYGEPIVAAGEGDFDRLHIRCGELLDSDAAHDTELIVEDGELEDFVGPGARDGEVAGVAERRAKIGVDGADEI